MTTDEQTLQVVHTAAAVAECYGHDLGPKGVTWEREHEKYVGACVRCHRIVLVECEGGRRVFSGGATRYSCQPIVATAKRQFFGRTIGRSPVEVSSVVSGGEGLAAGNSAVPRTEKLVPSLKRRPMTLQPGDIRRSVYLPPPGFLAWSLLYRMQR